MSWQDQGRQAHGRFGSGTGPGKLDDGDDADLFSANGQPQRMEAAINAAIAALPAKSRHAPFARLGGERVTRLADAMTKWSSAGASSDGEFAATFFNRDSGDPAIKLLRKAADTAASARSHADLRQAASLLAKAGQQIGLDRWPRFIDEAIKLAAPVTSVTQGGGGTANDDTGGSRQKATIPETTSPGVEVRLPNGETIPDDRSPTGNLMSPTGDLSPVAAAGRETGSTWLSLRNNPDGAAGAKLYLLASLAANLGHGGKFDYQRRGSHFTGFTQLRQFRDVSNVNVGMFCQQAGLTHDETLTYSGFFARHFSGNAAPEQPYGLDLQTARFINVGFDLGRSVFLGLLPLQGKEPECHCISQRHADFSVAFSGFWRSWRPSTSRWPR